MDERQTTFTCSDCKATITIKSETLTEARSLLKSMKWAVSRPKHDKEGYPYRDYYCPNCAPGHKSVGCMGAARAVQIRLNLG